MKQKILLLFILFNVLFLYSIKAFASFNPDSTIIFSKSEQYYGSGGNEIPYWQTIKDGHDNIRKTVYLYDLELHDVIWRSTTISAKEVNLYDPDPSRQLTYQYVWGQLFNWALDNKGKVQVNKTSLGDINKSSNFDAIYAIEYNRRNSSGISYMNQRGLTYPVSYPEVVRVEDSTYNIQGFPSKNWNFKPLPDSTSQTIPWLTHSSGIKGVPRYVFSANPKEEYGGTMGYPYDIGDDIGATVINPNTIIKYPYNNVPSLPMDKGQVNIDFDKILSRKPTDKMIETYKVFRTFYPSLESLMKKEGSITLEEQTRTFLDYFAVRSYAGVDSYGWIEMKNDLDPNGNHLYTYITIRTPKLNQNRDLVFGTKEKPLIDKNGAKRSITVWDRDPDNNGVYGETGTAADVQMKEGESKLVPNHKYSLHSYLTFLGQKGDKTYHHPIVTNVYAAYNDFAEGGTYARQDMHELIHDVHATDIFTQQPIEGKVNVGDLLDYRSLDNVTFPKEFKNPKTGQMEVIKKVSIYSYTPYQATDPATGQSQPNYHVTPEMDTNYLQKDDNAIAPDYCVATFDIDPPVRDLKITSFKFYDPSPTDPSKAHFLAEGDVLEREKTYKAIITVKNFSDYYKTDATIGVHFFDGIKGEQYTTDTIAPNLTSVSSAASQIPASSAGVTNPIPPTDVADAKKGTVQFVTNVTIPKDGYLPPSVKFTALIPDLYDINKTGKDNIRVSKDDKVDLTFKTDVPAGENLKITDLQLYDGTTGDIYNSQSPDGTFKFNPNRTYTAVVKMSKEGKKALGSASDGTHPRVLLKVIQYSGTNSSTQIVNQYYIRAKSSTFYQATSTQQTITLEYDFNKFPINGNRVTLVACVPSEYTNFNGTNYNEVVGNEDQMEKTWSSELDFSVSNFIINPAVTYTTSTCTSTQSTTIGFSAIIAMVNNTANINVDRVSLVVKDQYGSIVYRDDNVSFGGGQYTKTYSGTFPNPYTLRIDGFTGIGNQQGNNPFTIEINTTPVRYQETIWTNNKETNEVVLKSSCNPPPPPMPCLSPHTRNDWGPITFYFSQRTGSLHSKEAIGESCSGVEPNVSCHSYTYTVYWCDPDNWKSWTTDKSFYETFGITGIWFRSQDTVSKGISGYINILGNKNGTVRQGQWYEVYIETRYDTNRSDMPSPTPYSNDMCNYLTRSPGYSVLSSTPSRIWWKMSGYGVDEFMPYNTGTGGYTKRYYLTPKVDKFGQTSSRRFIAENGKDGVIDITVATDDQFYGYTYDSGHPYAALCDRKSAKIYVTGATNIKSQITEE